MSVNKYHPHLYVLPEDEADRDLANGFHLEIDQIGQMQVLPIVGGWRKVLERFQSDHIGGMKRYPQRYIVLLIDFDGQKDRFNEANEAIPNDLRDRVFVLGVWDEPEDLARAGLGHPETVGRKLARECREETDQIWGHDLFRHNASELERLRKHILPILFDK